MGPEPPVGSMTRRPEARLASRIDHSKAFEAALEAYLASEDFRTNDALRLPRVRDLLTVDRFRNLFGAKMQTRDSDAVSAVTVEHNSDIDRMFFSELSARPDLISNVLASLNHVRQNSGRMKVLSVGSRTEAEVFSLVNAGFNIRNVTAVDLISYTPAITIGDINALDFPDDSFDVVICGWVLEFCTDIPRAAAELKRVARPGAYMAVGGMHHPVSLDMNAYNRLKRHEDRVWYCSIPAIAEAFHVAEPDFIFKSGVEPEDLDKRGDVVAIFRNVKTDV